MQAQIIVLDYGGQYAHLICRRIRQLGVLAEIKSPTVDASELKGIKGLILSGGPASVGKEGAPEYNPKVFDLGIPILGICYGHQVMCNELGGNVNPGDKKEYGQAKLNIKKNKLFEGLCESERVWMSHGDTVTRLPDGFEVIGSTSDCENAAVGDDRRNFYGLQFHPEVTHTPNGNKIFSNFLETCECEKNWNMKEYLKKICDDVVKKVGDNSVFLLVSGGVDSTVCFALLEKALGVSRVYGLHIDNGFVRQDESHKVKQALEEHGFNLHVVDASKEFLDAVKGIYDPEEKRKIIGEKFIEVQAKVVAELGLDSEKWLLAQGTIYPDTIETGGTKNSALIKTHHNRVEVVQKLIDEGKVIEPISELYKDEVRELGEELGLPHDLVWRHPFPGPGLAVRCLCAKNPNNVSGDIVNRVGEVAEKFGLKGSVLPIKSVGVQGDFRTYKHPAVLVGDADWDKLELVSTEVTNTILEVNRVVYCIKGKLSEVKDVYLTKDRLDILREVDNIVNTKMLEYKLEKEIWQFPVVLIPGDGIVLRPVYSKEAMTAEFARIDMKIVKEIAEEIIKLGISSVYYDVTHKPPGTIEWE